MSTVGIPPPQVTPKPPIKSEIIRPRWRDGRAYAEALSNRRVMATIKETILTGSHPSTAQRPAAKAELDHCFGCLTGDLRLHDLGSHSYWIWMLMLSLMFVLVELLIVLAATPSGASSRELTRFLNLVVVNLSVLVFLLVLYAVVLLQQLTSSGMPAALQRIPVWTYPALPVVWVSGFLVALNFFVVTQTGYGTSPFLHALLASVLLVLSLPRDNSLAVVVLGLVAVAMGCVGIFHTETVTEEVLTAWGGPILAQGIVSLTFLYSAASILLLRGIANYKVEPRP